jgi:excisionase family DNA binding protein
MGADDFRRGLSLDTFSVPETAAYLNVSDEMVRQLLIDGQIHGFRLGRRKLRVSKASVAQYLAEQRQVSAFDFDRHRALNARRRRNGAGLRAPSLPASRRAPAPRPGAGASTKKRAPSAVGRPSKRRSRPERAS